MPVKTTDPTALVTDAIVTGVKQTQELALSGVSLWADIATKAFSASPFEAPSLKELAAKPRELLVSGFGLAEEILSSQKEFALKLVDSVAAKAPTPAA
jgi:hypothetical protein